MRNVTSKNGGISYIDAGMGVYANSNCMMAATALIRGQIPGLECQDVMMFDYDTVDYRVKSPAMNRYNAGYQIAMSEDGTAVVFVDCYGDLYATTFYTVGDDNTPYNENHLFNTDTATPSILNARSILVSETDLRN